MNKLTQQEYDCYIKLIISLVNNFGLLNTIESLATLAEHLATGTDSFNGNPQWFEIAAIISDCHSKVQQAILRNSLLKE